MQQAMDTLALHGIEDGLDCLWDAGLLGEAREPMLGFQEQPPENVR